ncbi:MAG: LamG-like jellyroll fold domain-containing protein, partial [Bacteroidota bacterium]
NDILRARLFYTGGDSIFNTSTELGTPIVKPNGEFTFSTVAQNLVDGDNYFWLTFDVEELAQVGNFLDAELLTVLIDDLLYTPGVIGDPVGARLIKLPDCGAFTGIGFQNTGGYAEIASGLDIPGAFTVEAWMYPYQDTEERWILGETDGMYIFQNRNVYEFYIYDGASFIGPATAPVTVNNWNHLAAVFDDAGDELRLYVNGRLGTPFTYSGGANVDGAGEFVLGADNSGGPFNDMILDELKIWNKAKTQLEVRRGFRIIAQTNEDQLMHYWQFNEASGTEAIDLINEKVFILNGNTWDEATESVGCGVVGVPTTTRGTTSATTKSSTATYTWLGTLSDITVGFSDALVDIPPQSDFFAVEIFGAPATPPGGFDVPGSYWVIENFNPSLTTFQPLSIQLNLQSAELRSNNASDYRLTKRQSGGGNPWSILRDSPSADPFVAVTVDTTSDVITFAGQVGNSSLTSFDVSSDFFLTSVFDPLPISLLSFIGVRENDDEVRLIWETASELNNKGFEIEKSLDARNFSSIGYVDGAGTSSGLRTYDFLDNDARSSVYYRLKQVDFDGEFTYSPIVFVEGTVQDFFNIYPNPVQDFIELDAS